MRWPYLNPTPKCNRRFRNNIANPWSGKRKVRVALPLATCLLLSPESFRLVPPLCQNHRKSIIKTELSTYHSPTFRGDRSFLCCVTITCSPWVVGSGGYTHKIFIFDVFNLYFKYGVKMVISCDDFDFLNWKGYVEKKCDRV